jgi:hypothetical protein
VFALLATAGVANCMALPAVSLILPVFKDKAVVITTKEVIMQTKVNSVVIHATNATGAGKSSTLKIGDKIIGQDLVHFQNLFTTKILKA